MRLDYLLIAGLAVFRLAQFIAIDQGPFGICQFSRNALGRWASGRPHWSIQWTLAELFSCPYCIGLWLALIPAAFLGFSPFSFIAYWLGIAGFQALLQGVVSNG